jgi:FSR family fosmidomycin resistance protein-like MFS transporter
LGNSVFHPADFAALNHRVSPARLGHAFSVHGLTGYLGYSAAPVLMVVLAVGQGWRVALGVATAIGAATAFAVWLQKAMITYEIVAPGAKRLTPNRGLRAMVAPLLSSSIVACFVFFICTGFAGMGTQSFVPAMFAAVYGVPLLFGASLLTGFLLSVAAGMFAGGFVVGATTRHEWVAAAAMTIGAAMFVLFASGATPVRLLAPALCATGFVLGVSYPSRDMLVRAAAPQGATGRTYGIVYSGVDVGASIAPVVLGWMLDHGRPEWTFLAVAAMLAANVALAFQAVVRRRAPEA